MGIRGIESWGEPRTGRQSPRATTRATPHTHLLARRLEAAYELLERVEEVGGLLGVLVAEQHARLHAWVYIIWTSECVLEYIQVCASSALASLKSAPIYTRTSLKSAHAVCSSSSKCSRRSDAQL